MHPDLEVFEPAKRKKRPLPQKMESTRQFVSEYSVLRDNHQAGLARLLAKIESQISTIVNPYVHGFGMFL